MPSIRGLGERAMPATRLQLTPHLTCEELTSQFRACRDGLAKVRWQALWLLSRPHDPYSADQVAEVVGLTADAIRKLVRRYNAGGPPAVGSADLDDAAGRALPAGVSGRSRACRKLPQAVLHT